MPRSLFLLASVFIVSTLVLHVSGRVMAMEISPVIDATALTLGAIAFCVLCGSMWFLYRAVPSPGMLCCAMAVNVLGAAAAIDAGLLDNVVGRTMAEELSIHVVMTAIVLLVASVLLMPKSSIVFLKEVVIPALLGRSKR